MTGASAAVGGETSTDSWQRISTPASTVGPWLPEGDLGGRLAEGLGRVEEALLTAVGSEHAFVREAAGHLVSAGGKRFRPLLALLAAQLGDPRAPGVTEAAVVCELTHLATLYHDDVMDEAAVRRGAPSANSRWSNSIAILTGDLLFARASDLLADKTGSLVATSVRFGATFAGVDERLVESLTAFGEEVGVAFQISDDLLDIVSEGGASGKQPGTDLREGIATLPVLFALAGDDPAEARLRELVSRPVTDDAEHVEALELLRTSASLARATEVLASYADRARARL